MDQRIPDFDALVGGSDAAHSAVRIAFVPGSPMLVPELTGDPAGARGVRTAAAAAVEWLTQDGRPIAVLANDDQTRDLAADSYRLTGLGRDIGSGEPAGLAVGIARFLLDPLPVAAHTIAADASAAACVRRAPELPAGHNWLVVGDGSAGRSEKSPGHVLAGSERFDEVVTGALSRGDQAALGHLDLGAADAVWAAGARPWKVIGSAVRSVSDAGLDVVESPFGVTYLVGRWRARWASQA